MNFVLLYPSSFDISEIEAALMAEGISTVVVESHGDIVAGGKPTVLILDAPSRSDHVVDGLRAFVEDGGAIVIVGAPDERAVPEVLPDNLVSAFVPQAGGARALLLAIRAGLREAAARIDRERARLEADARTKELQELTRIGMALSTERDYNTLQTQILSQARQITSSDACSLYLVETDENEQHFLRFAISETSSRPDIPFVEFKMPISKGSIAGYVATTGDPLVIDDVYFIPPDVEYQFNRAFDEKYGYRSKSMLTIPMQDHKSEVIGVLQLINRKRHLDAQLLKPEDFDREVIPYTPRLVELVSAMAGQAAVSIENSKLYEDIERLFEGFVTASVTAIEQRDPTTFGHSGRVASMTEDLAKTLDGASDGKYRGVSFSREQLREIRYAGLLHDFGKVGVREQVLVKAKKLYPTDMTLVKQRYQFVFRTVENNFNKQRADFLEKNGKDGYEKFLGELEQYREDELHDLDRFMKLVVDSNEPTVLPEGSFDELIKFADKYYQDLEGRDQPYLSDDEVRFLTIRKGSLDASERLEIESHVTHTYRFLMEIPWTKELQFIPRIAYGHHEKLNGGGYPQKISADGIPIQTRMMTISDIFDALTASDRPYKRAVPVDRALDILRYEVDGGMLDPELFDVFVDAKVYERQDPA
jgi:HD-GYP domain-containing protein (c-di-GMP phosphodiesterase class II)